MPIIHKKIYFLISGILMLAAVFLFIFPNNPARGSIDCCYNECQPTDSPKCDGTWLQKCDKCDSDPYYDWCDQTNCAVSGQICLNGACQAMGVPCAITCATGPGCRFSLANGAAAAGECCSTGDCYDCKPGWSWSGSTCVSICADNDSDGYGNPAAIACAKPKLDCDDSNANINPGKTEICDGADNNCDGQTDEGCDQDNDDYCACGQTFTYGSDLTAVCSGTNTTDATAVANTCDCKDNNAGVHPAAAEICDNGLDDDCDTKIDCADTGCSANAACTGATTCSDNTQISTCSTATGAPWYCDNAKNLIEKCSSCGCAGSWVCSIAGSYCCDNACNGSCSPAGCTVAKDPDCGCLNGNSCCGVGCNNGNDNDCAASCMENWTCAAWSACANGSQTRVCSDGNNCGTIASKPKEVQNCLSVVIIMPDNDSNFNTGNVMFTSKVIGGNGPYSYVWHSSIDGNFGENNFFTGSDLSIGDHIITVTVTDHSSKIADNSINITIHPSNTLVVNIETWRTEFAQGENFWPLGSISGGVKPYAYKWESNIDGILNEDSFNPMLGGLSLGEHILTFTVTDSLSSTASDSIIINIVPMTAIINPQDGDTFTYNATVFFSAWVEGGVAPYTYLWKSSINGEIGNTGNFSRDDLSVGVHTITVTINDSGKNTITRTFNIQKIPACISDSCNGICPAECGAEEDPDCGCKYNNDCCGIGCDFASDNDCILPCISDGCNGICPAGCDTGEDPDCGCLNNNGCCGVGCFNPTDNNCPICAPDGCNGICPAGCDTGEDPDCGCLNNNGCCGVGCNNINDNNCAIDCVSDGCNFNCPLGCNLDQDPDCGCQTGNDCCGIGCNNASDKECSIATNIKDFSKYSEKEIFLVSNENWQDVLSLVPVTTWTDGGTVYKYPTLIYHKEAANIYDADSILHFIQQYSTGSITAIGLLPVELNGFINADGITPGIISISDYLSYWSSYNTVVYVENNYQLALLASTYASLKNAPLVIQGTALDAQKTFAGKIVYTVGSLGCPASAGSCINFANAQALKQEYLNQTNTDKIILVNSDDLNIHLTSKYGAISFNPLKASNPITKVYGKSSLAAPFLASAKHEIILSTTAVDYGSVASFLRSEILALGIKPKYLTIVAAPNAIQISRDSTTYVGVGGDKEELDNLVYGRFNDNDFFQQMAVGRIFSLTTSDVSSNIARSLYYEKLTNSNNFAMLWTPYFVKQKIQGKANGELLERLGYNNQSIYLDEGYTELNTVRDMSDKFLINYLDHGNALGWMYITTKKIRDNNIYLSNSLVAGDACLTCAYDVVVSDKEYLFCANIIRQGGLAYLGAVDSIPLEFNFSQPFLNQVFNNKSFGEALKNSKAQNALYKIITSYHNELWYVLIGDPTFNFNITYPHIDKEYITSSGLKISLYISKRESTFSSTVVGGATSVSLRSALGPDVYMNETVKPTTSVGSGDHIFSKFVDIPVTPLLSAIDHVEYIKDDGKIVNLGPPGITTSCSKKFSEICGNINKFPSDIPISNIRISLVPNAYENRYFFYLHEYYYSMPDIPIPPHTYKIYLK